jgi:hypothetical protein
MKSFLLFFTVLTFFNCTKVSNDMQIYLYKKGEKIKLDNSSLNLSEINNLLNSLIKNANEFMRLYMDEDRFESLKKKEAVVEFIFKNEISILSNHLGELKFKRVLIPVTGDFVGNVKSANTTLFIGDDKYFPEPISNQNGYGDLLKLKLELEREVRD